MKKIILLVLIVGFGFASCVRQPLGREEENDDSLGRLVLKLNDTVVFDKSFDGQFYWIKSRDMISFQYAENNEAALEGQILHIPPLHETYPITDTMGTGHGTYIFIVGKSENLTTPDGQRLYNLMAVSGSFSHTEEKSFHGEGQCMILYSDNWNDFGFYNFELDVKVAKIVEE